MRIRQAGKVNVEKMQMKEDRTLTARVHQRLKARGVLAVAQNIAMQFHVPLRLLLSRQKTKSVALARKSLYQAMRNLHMSNVEIGQLLERDSSSVLAGLRASDSSSNLDSAAE